MSKTHFAIDGDLKEMFIYYNYFKQFIKDDE